jgi:multidrug efflux pump subunit AcrB
MWVIVGIPIAFLGTLWLMPLGPWPVTINMVSLFGFILVLGIVVDDAIIIGESIYTKVRADGHTLDNVIRGVHRVAVPATFGVLTTIAAFAPMLFVGGIAGAFFEAMSMVVILCLIFSLVESKLILPAHLVHTSIPPSDDVEIFRPYREIRWHRRLPRFFQRLNRNIHIGLHRFIDTRYRPLLEKAVDNRGLTFSIFAAVLVLTVGLMNSGMVRTVLFPDVPGDFIQVQLAMQNGTAPQIRNAALDRLEQAALDLNQAWLTEYPGADQPINHLGVFTEGDTGGMIFAEMPMDEDRALNGDDIES